MKSQGFPSPVFSPLPEVTISWNVSVFISWPCFYSCIQRMNRKFSSVQSLSSVWLCDPIDWSMPRFPVHHCNSRSLLKLIPSSWWFDPTISSSVVPFSSRLQSFPASGSFPMSQSFTSDDQSIGVSASASVLPMNIRDWFILGWTGWISLQSKGPSRVFSNTKFASPKQIKSER